jgi:hypothetical protein
MDPHCPQLRRPAHHLGGVAEVERIADVAFSESDLDVAKALGDLADRRQIGFAGLECV